MKTFTLTVHTFEMGSAKESAIKVLEEASEVRAAWQEVEHELAMGMPFDKYLAEDLGYEIADCITACCNLAERYGIDLKAMLKKVEKSNRERGRYEGTKNAEH